MEFGEVAEPLARFFLDNPPNAFCGGEDMDRLPVRSDDADGYWARGVNAPSARDMRDMDARLDFMDSTGIAQTLIFGSGLLWSASP